MVVSFTGKFRVETAEGYSEGLKERHRPRHVTRELRAGHPSELHGHQIGTRRLPQWLSRWNRRSE